VVIHAAAEWPAAILPRRLHLDVTVQAGGPDLDGEFAGQAGETGDERAGRPGVETAYEAPITMWM
jgi:hypothetical protein